MKHQRYMLKLLIYVLLCAAAISAYPLPLRRPRGNINFSNQKQIQKNDENGAIISVRITSSVAVERGKKEQEHFKEFSKKVELPASTRKDAVTTERANVTHAEAHQVSASERHSVTALPPSLVGANIEFLKQLRSKKEGKSLHNTEHLHPFHLTLQKHNDTIEDSVAEASQIDVHGDPEIDEDDDSVPRARSIPLNHFANRFHTSNSKVNVTRDWKRNSTTSAVSIHVVHSPPIHPIVYSEPAKVYSEPAKVYSEPAKVYGKPELFYSEPAKVYGEPSKVYGEPSKIYSEPAKVYSEPAKVYGEPSKFYSEPASLFLEQNEPRSRPPNASESTTSGALQTIKAHMSLPSTEAPSELPDRSYKEEEPFSAKGEGRTHGVQEPESTTVDNKVGYVLEGSDYRKYRVEERTADGFIVGEYGVVSHNDGSLRGVRYTADADTNPRLIYDALMKFLHLT